MKKLILTLIVTLVLVNVPVAWSEITPALSIEQHGGPTYPGTNRTHGWEFTVNEDVQVVALGIFDYEDDPLYAPGLIWSHDIGMWHDGELISSTIIPAGTDILLVDDFRYVEIDPFWLDAGETYIIGNTMPIDPFVGNDSDSIITTLPLITYERTMISEDGSGFSLPTLEIDSFYRIGPNFLVIPEPTTLFLLSLGITLIRRRRNGPKSQ